MKHNPFLKSTKQKEQNVSFIHASWVTIGQWRVLTSEKKVNTNKDNTLQKSEAVKSIYSITPFTLLDYPDNTACILWFAGCNMRCGYCYNPEIVKGKGKLTFEDALDFLKKRQNLLDGVVLSGGESTLHQNLPWLAHQIKSMGMKVKLDTNGSRPHVLENLLAQKLVDYVALDFKALPKSYEKITVSKLFDEFEQSLEVLISSQIPFEIRTTLHSSLISSEDLIEMTQYLHQKGYSGTYYLQHFVGEKDILGSLPESFKKLYLQLKFPIEVIWRN